MFYSNSCVQYIASGTLLTTHINATNEKKKKKGVTEKMRCNRMVVSNTMNHSLIMLLHISQLKLWFRTAFKDRQIQYVLSKKQR